MAHHHVQLIRDAQLAQDVREVGVDGVQWTLVIEQEYEMSVVLDVGEAMVSVMSVDPPPTWAYQGEVHRIDKVDHLIVMKRLSVIYAEANSRAKVHALMERHLKLEQEQLRLQEERVACLSIPLPPNRECDEETRLRLQQLTQLRIRLAQDACSG
jgi:hypothetical protein